MASSIQGKLIENNGVVDVALEPVVSKAADEAAGLIAVIERMAANPQVDVSKLEKVIELQERILKHHAEVAFNMAFTEMQPQIPVILERHEGDQGKWSFAPLEDIVAPMRPILAAHGFSLSHQTEWPDPKTVRVVGILTHKSGHSRRSEFQSVADATGSKNAIQALASAVSYGKRYTTKDLLCIVTRGEDDDGRAAGGKPPAPTPSGYAAWEANLDALASSGMAAWEAGWKKSPEAFTKHLAATEPKRLASLKVKAQKASR